MCNTDSGACVKGVSVHTLHDIDIIDIDNLFCACACSSFRSLLSSQLFSMSGEPRAQKSMQRSPRRTASTTGNTQGKTALHTSQIRVRTLYFDRGFERRAIKCLFTSNLFVIPCNAAVPRGVKITNPIV